MTRTMMTTTTMTNSSPLSTAVSQLTRFGSVLHGFLSLNITSFSYQLDLNDDEEDDEDFVPDE